jgi:hypothetical protein
MTLLRYEIFEQMLAEGLITLPESLLDDLRIQFPCNHPDSFADAHRFAMERIVQLTGLPPDLLLDHGSPTGDSTIYSVIVDDPLGSRLSEDRREEIRQFAENAGIGNTAFVSQLLNSEDIAAAIESPNRISISYAENLQSSVISAEDPPLDNERADQLRTWIEGRQREEAVRRESFLAVCNRQMESLSGASPLQQKCRTCTYRNKDFDRRVPPEHSRDLKCAINPSYAMTGVGECSDFVEESLPAKQTPSSSVNLAELFTDTIQAMPEVVNLNVECIETLFGLECRLLITLKSQVIEYKVSHANLTRGLPTILHEIRDKILWARS